MDVKTNGWWKTGYIHTIRVTPQKIFINYKIVISWRRSLADAILTKWSRSTSLVTGQMGAICLLIRCAQKNASPFLWYSWPKYRTRIYNLEETPIKPKLKDVFQNKWPVCFKNLQVMKNKERLSNCPWIKETKEMWQLNVIYDPQLKSGPEGKLFFLWL